MFSHDIATEFQTNPIPMIKSLLRCGLLASLLIQSLAPAVAQRDLKDIPTPEPAEEQKTFVVPDGFEVNLFAADPMIAKPIQMNFDETGRLWIVSSEVYPHIAPGAPMSDRVVVLEDNDHDGVSDKTHVFAEGLLIPTGIAPGDGGVYVANSTQLLHFADDNNDLKADSKRVVLSGFGTEDTHHILHTLRWGPDGYLYFNQSIYIHSHIETPWGVRRLNAGGIWQFRPETLELGVFMRGLVNTWGHHFDRFGQSFATDGAGGEGINYIVPGAYYFTAADAPKILNGLNPGSPKHCGLEIVETPMLPPEWQGSAITNDFRGHRVCRFQLTEDRSGFVSREQQEVIKSDHVAFRPIDVKLGPDGAIYIADWYNPIIQHGEVDFRDPRRDHTHGRIWRVTWKGAPKRRLADPTKASNTELLEQLRSDDNFHRQAAKQILRRRGDAVLADLRQWLDTIPKNETTEHLRLEALWVFQSLRTQNHALLHELLQAQDGRVRAAAVRVLSHWRLDSPAAGKPLLAAAVNDVHPRVRLEAVRAISYSPNQDSERQLSQTTTGVADGPNIETAMLATDHPTDQFLDYAIWLTARELSADWIPAFEKGSIDFDNNVQHLLTAFSAVGRGAPVDFLLTKLHAETTTDVQRDQVVQLIGSTGTAEQLSKLVVAAASHDDAQSIRNILAATRARQNLAVPLDAATLAAMQESDLTALRSAALIAAGQWQTENALQQLTMTSENAETAIPERLAACEGLALMGSEPARQQLNAVAADTTQPTVLRKHSAALLTGLDPGTGAKVTAALLSTMKLEEHPEDLARSFLAVRNGSTILAKTLAGVTLDSAVAREILRVVRESGLAAPELEAALKTSGKITSRKTINDEERLALLTLSNHSASAAEGEQVYRNEKLGCLKCHAIGGAGGKVGPDMISLGGSAQPDYLLESLLNPNAKVKENYHTVVIETTAGKVLSGVQVKQSKEEVVVRTANDELLTVARADIEDIAPGLSLMPEGLVDTLTDQEVAALVRFLSELGRTPEYTISRRQVARTWQVMEATDAAAFQLRRTSYATAATDDPAYSWLPKYSNVAGNLSMPDVPVVAVKSRSAAGTRGVGFARCFVTIETPGTLQLKVNGTQGLELRGNELPINLVQNTVTIDVVPGILKLTLTIDQEQRTIPVELEILPGSTAVAKFQN